MELSSLDVDCGALSNSPVQAYITSHAFKSVCQNSCLRSSTIRQSVVFVFFEWERLYPSVPLTYHAIGLRQRAKSLTQNASPWSIPRLFLIRGPISWLPALVLSSKVIAQIFIRFSKKATSFSLILCIFRTSMSQTCETLSKAYSTSIQVEDKFLLFLVSSSNIALSISGLSMHPIDPGIPSLWSSCIYILVCWQST